jgi:hypothetical protein
MGYVESGDRIALEFNLLALEKLSSSDSSTSAPDWSRLRDRPRLCEGKSVEGIRKVLETNAKTYFDCALSEPESSGTKASELRIVTGELAGVPLYRFNKNSKPRVMELYGLFRGEELEWVDVE